MAWTAEQEKAITKRDSSLLLSAGAGSGKTAVLVEHLIQIICDESIKVPADKLLVVTFTKAAASEMKKRVGEALRMKLKENPRSEFLQNQMLLLHHAEISTIHSFCLNLIKEQFAQLDIEQNIRIADEIELALLQAETAEEIMENHYQLNDAIFQQVVDYYGKNEDEGVVELILNLYHQSRNTVQPTKWLYSLEEKLEQTDWISLINHYIKKDITQCYHTLKQALQICEIDDYGLQKYIPAVSYAQEQIKKCIELAETDWNAFIDLTDSIIIFENFPRLTKKDFYDEVQKDQVRELYSNAKSQFNKILEKISNAKPSQVQGDIHDLKPLYHCLIELTIEFSEEFQKRKRKRNFIDYNDMEHLTLQLLYDDSLQPTPLSLEIKERYYQVLIDEYQDTNNLQEMIMRGVSRDDNYFMVGDTKQSIYGFRNANPKLFNQKYISLPAEAVIDMNTNFRSRANILNGVNDLFSLIMNGEDDNPIYDYRAALKCGNNIADEEHPDEAIEVWVLNNTKENILENPIMDTTSESTLIGEEIQRLVREGKEVYDKNLKQFRPITYNDIVILMRGTKNHGETVFETLKEMGIPVYLDTVSGYFDTWEVSVTLDLLKVLDNPYQDLPLAAVLKLPCFHFTEDELLQICQNKKRYLYENMQAVKQEDAVYKKVQDALMKIVDWRILTTRISLSDVIWELYKETNLYQYVLGLPQGAQRQANLKTLYDKAQKFENTDFKGLFMFLSFIDEMKKNDQTIPPPNLLSEDANVVRIMTIHHSKGLEFPVVFLPNIGKKFNYKDIQTDILLDKELGLALYNVDMQASVKYDTIMHEVIRYKMIEDMVAEEKRILYVALTRAREKLYLIGRDKGESTQNYLKWILSLRETKTTAKWNFRTIDCIEDSTDAIIEEIDADVKAILLDKSKFSVDEDYFIKEKTLLEWKYPYYNDTQLPLKTSVSELNRNQNIRLYRTSGDDLKELDLNQDTTLSAAQKGTLVHTIMRHIDLTQEIDETYLQELISILERKAIVPLNVASQINLESIVRFFQAPYGQRLKHAQESYRELPFTYAVASDMINCISDTTQSILVQGIIDCMWREDEGLVLLDYKTDRVKEGEEEEIAQHYKNQLMLYKNAIEEIWQEKVVKVYLYLFSAHKAIDMTEIVNNVTLNCSDFSNDIV